MTKLKILAMGLLLTVFGSCKNEHESTELSTCHYQDYSYDFNSKKAELHTNSCDTMQNNVLLVQDYTDPCRISDTFQTSSISLKEANKIYYDFTDKGIWPEASQ